MPPNQKREHEAADSILEGVKSIVLDIEGTITPISFVKDKLFPYVTENIESYMNTKYDEKETQADIEALRDLAKKEDGAVQIPDNADGNKADVVKAVVEFVNAQMDTDSKATELKQLQGHIWRDAYKTKKVEGELFEDVGPVLQQLCEEDFNIYIYSSGSVESQKLLISNSTDGDLSDIFHGYFDTTSGSKKEAASYKKIKAKIAEDGDEGSIESEEILFLTDDPEEANAAREAGWQAVLVDRSLEQEGSIELDEEARQNFQVIENLHDLFGDDELDDIEGYEQAKRQKFSGNGEYDDDDDDEVDEEEGDEGEEDAEEEEEGDEEEEA